MLGILIGTACLIGFVVTALGGACHGGRRHGRCGAGRGFGAPFGWGRGGGRGGRRFWLRGLYERLETSPGQERVIEASLDEARRGSEALRGEWAKSREDAAKLLRGRAFDPEMLGEAFARQSAALEAMQKALAGALGRVHEALDERQRRELADLVERRAGFGGRFGREGGPYRS